MGTYRTIDARGIWWGDPKALDVFARAYGLDCGGDDATWHRVYGWTPAALEQAKARAFPNMRPDLDAFTQGYLEACFFTECSPEYDSDEWESEECRKAQEEGQAGGTLPGDVGFGDLGPSSLAAAIHYCASWQEANAALLDDAYARAGYDASRAGNDLWFTANGHGVGYWDRGLGAIGDKLTDAAGHHPIDAFYQDGAVYLDGFPK